MEIVAIIFSTVALCISGFSIFYTVKQNELKSMIEALSEKPTVGKYPRNEKGLMDTRLK